MTDMRCWCGRRLRWGEWRDRGGPATYCPVHDADEVKQPIAIPVEAEWHALPSDVALEDLLPDTSEVDAEP